VPSGPQGWYKELDLVLDKSSQKFDSSPPTRKYKEKGFFWLYKSKELSLPSYVELVWTSLSTCHMGLGNNHSMCVKIYILKKIPST